MVGGITPDDGTVTLPEIEMTKAMAAIDIILIEFMVLSLIIINNVIDYF